MRMTSMKVAAYGEKGQITIDETVRGEGEHTIDALQSLLDNMEERCKKIRMEIHKIRGERL